MDELASNTPVTSEEDATHKPASENIQQQKKTTKKRTIHTNTESKTSTNEDFASNISGTSVQNVAFKPASGHKPSVKYFPKGHLRDHGEAFVGDITAHFSRASVDSFSSIHTRCTKETCKKRLGIDPLRSSESDVESGSSKVVSSRSSKNRARKSFLNAPDESATRDVEDPRSKIRKQNRTLKYIKGSIRDPGKGVTSSGKTSFVNERSKLHVKEDSKTTKNITEKNQKGILENIELDSIKGYPSDHVKSPRGHKEQPIPSVEEKSENHGEEFTVKTQNTSRHHEKEPAVEKTKRTKFNAKELTAEKIKSPRHQEDKPFIKSAKQISKDLSHSIVKKSTGDRKERPVKEEMLEESKKTEENLVKDSSDDNDELPAKYTDFQLSRMSTLNISMGKEKIEKKPKGKYLLGHEKIKSSEFTDKTDLQTPDVSEPPNENDDVILFQKKRQLRAKTDSMAVHKMDTSKKEGIGLKREKRAEERRRSLERLESMLTLAQQTSMKLSLPSVASNFNDSKQFVRTKEPSRVVQRNTNVQELLRWTTRARQRDLEEWQHRLARKEALAKMDYDPYVHRAHCQLTNWATFMHLCNGFLGLGIILLGIEFSMVGMFLAVLCFFVLSILSSYCINMTLRNEYAICRVVKEPYLGLPRTLEYAVKHGPAVMRFLAPCFRYCSHAIMILRGLTTVASYHYYTGVIIQQISEMYFHRFKKYVYMWILMPFLMLCSLFLNMKTLLVTSVSANLLTFAGCIMIVITILNKEKESVVKVELIAEDVWAISLFVNGVLFCVNNFPVVAYIERKMCQPQNILGVKGILIRSKLFASAIILVVGISSYAHLGKDMPMLLPNSFPAITINNVTFIIIACSWILAYPLNIHVLHDLIWGMLVKNVVCDYSKNQQFAISHALKFGLILASTAVVTFLPDFPFWGAQSELLCVPLLVLSLPAIVEICLCWEMRDFGRFHYVFYKNMFFIIISLYFSIFGMVFTSLHREKVVRLKG